MTEVSAESEFKVHDGSACMNQSKWTGETTIYMDKLDYENLGDLIHEINEAEIYQLLFCDFDIDSEKSIILSPFHLRLIENELDFGLATNICHLISPYGYNCFIGRENEPKW